MLSHFSLTFFHPSFPSPPATAARSAIPLCPVIPVTAVAWAKDKAGSETLHSSKGSSKSEGEHNLTATARDQSSCVQDAPVPATAQGVD